MRSLGIAEDRLLETGLLVKREDGSTAPRFRSRLLFPIHDLRGRVVGFGGRVLADLQPKYLNSPETPVFRKGSLLYNLHAAKHAIRKEETAIVVEGYFDVIRLSLAGVENVVAPLGTAMTSDQAALLKKSANTAILLYDSDPAGLRATFRSGDELLRHGMRVKVATLPPGEDPDTIVRTGGRSALISVLGHAVDVMERKVQLLEERGWLKDLSRRRAALDRLLPTIRVTKDPITRDLYLSIVSERTDVSREVLRQEVELLPTLTIQPPESATLRRITKRAESDPWKKRDQVAERYLTYILITSATWLERARDELPVSWLRCTPFAEIYSALLATGTEGLSQALDNLSEEGRRAYDLLIENETYQGIDFDESYVGSYMALEARPVLESLTDLLIRMRSEGDDLVKEELASEHRRLREEISARFPFDWLKHVYKRSFTKHRQPASKRPSEASPTIPAKRSAS
jgi:DNA primase